MASGNPNSSLPDQVEDLNNRLRVIEERLSVLGFDMKDLVSSEVKRSWRYEPQMTSMFGMVTALCINTEDPWKQNRIQFYTPDLHAEDTDPKLLPWAFPISPLGGFDDSGANWVPPAGSMVCLIFEKGNRDSAFYLGTTWTRNRGPAGKHNFNFPIPEYYQFYAGHRKGYLVGPDDESQVLPPWNTESYNGKDITSIEEFEADPEAKNKLSPPNAYGFKTPEKHTIKMVDGDPKSDRRYKRFEIISGTGVSILLKDDHMRPSGAYAHPQCSCGSGGDTSDYSANPDQDCGNPKEKPKCSNPYYKHKNECRMYKGPGTPQNNKMELNQSGFQVLTLSGQTIIMDDSVEQPRGKPTWERSMQDFDFGCNDTFKGKMVFRSATGVELTLDDEEDAANIRSKNSGFRVKTATGIELKLSDHTTEGGAEGDSKRAGSERGLSVTTSSLHTFKMIDHENQQASPDRKSGGIPVNKAKRAYILLRSGYGGQMMFADRASQQETESQFINIMSPQKDNTARGPHVLHMQEKKEGQGVVYLRAGGNMVFNSYDDMVEIVGDAEKNSANKVTMVSGKYIVNTGDTHYHHAGNKHILHAEDKILLMAGKDCDRTVTNEDGSTTVLKKDAPCIYNVVINRNPIKCPIVKWMCHFTPKRSTSERVFASGFSPEDTFVPPGQCTCC